MTVHAHTWQIDAQLVQDLQAQLQAQRQQQQQQQQV
jgi:hypothetical protein